MSNFVYDNVALNGSKVNRGPLPAGEDPNKWIQANQDWNPTIAALYDLRSAIIGNAFFGVVRQTIPTVPVDGAADFIWADGSGNLFWHKSGTGDQQLNGGGGGSTTLAAAYAAGAGPADSTIQLDTTRGGILIQDDPGQLSDFLFRVADSGDLLAYIDVNLNERAVQFYYDTVGGTYVLSIGGGGTVGMKFGADNTYDFGDTSTIARRIHTGMVSAGVLGTLSLRRGASSDVGIDMTGTAFNGTTDIAYAFGDDTTRFRSYTFKLGTIFNYGLGSTAPFDSGLLLKGKPLTASYPGSGVAEWSPPMEFAQCYGRTADPESGYATGRMAVQGRITPNSGSTLDTMRIAVLGDNGTGTYEAEYASFKRNLLEVYNAGVGVTQVVGARLQNSTSATAGNQKYSPMLELEGQGWKTNATASSQPTKWAMQARPVQGAVNPGVDLVFWTSINFGSYTEKFAIADAGIPKWSNSANVQTTVGAAGGASAPPAAPTKWLKVQDDSGTTYVIPAYNP